MRAIQCIPFSFVVMILTAPTFGHAGENHNRHNSTHETDQNRGEPRWSNHHDNNNSQSTQNQMLTLATLQTEPLQCVFNATETPQATAVFDPVADTVTTTTGSPATTQTFSNVTIVSGLQPYGNNGITFVAFGDVPLFSVTLQSSSSGNERCEGNDNDNDNDDNGNQTIVATWNDAPGGPQNVLNAGTCEIIKTSSCSCSDDDDDCNRSHHHHHFKRH